MSKRTQKQATNFQSERPIASSPPWDSFYDISLYLCIFLSFYHFIFPSFYRRPRSLPPTALAYSLSLCSGSFPCAASKPCWNATETNPKPRRLDASSHAFDHGHRPSHLTGPAPICSTLLHDRKLHKFAQKQPFQDSTRRRPTPQPLQILPRPSSITNGRPPIAGPPVFG